jgi:hypothetical protein
MGVLAGISVAVAGTTIQVLSATVKDKPVANAEIILQKNGQNSITGRTDAHGRLALAKAFDVDDNSVLLIIKSPSYSTLVVKCPCDGLTYALSETMTQLDGMRIVLTWGRDPYDLDSHLVYAGSHIYFDQKQGDKAWLDVDDTDSYGPETITIDKRYPGKRYLYAVHTYAAESAGPYKTQAKVQVYVGSSLMRTYYFMPRETDSVLVLFGINEYGEIYDINQRLSKVGGSNGVGTILAQKLGSSTYAVAQDDTGESDRARALQLNGDGEAAYHRHDLEVAIDLYRQAIDLYPAFGQAYSNLGLAYQKTGQVAEALWANRKAIGYAEGENKNVVRASSYYNIARIYEAQSRWDDALQNYEWAEQQNHNDVYGKAITRMRGKIAGH